MQTRQEPRQIDRSSILPIVVGMHLNAELTDRTPARRLARAIDHWQDNFCDDTVLVPVVMTDAWFLNTSDLHRQPTISVGHPTVNALSTSLIDSLPVADGVNREYAVHLDLNSHPLRACLWGAQPDDTVEAMDRFIDGYMDEFLGVAISRAAQCPI